MTFPPDPLAAVTAPDPYPYYAHLVSTTPLALDGERRMWTASSAAAVGDVLASDQCAVRPPAEPVPAALRGTTAGRLFAGFARMQDGGSHRVLRESATAVLRGFDPARVAAVSAAEAAVLAGGLRSTDPQRISEVALRLPVHVLSRCLRVSPTAWPAMVESVDAFAGCLAPGASRERVTRSFAAADRLVEILGAAGVADDAVPCAIGLLCQAYEATAGLIGNALVALGRSPGRDPGPVITDTLRDDPPVQNTRRHVIADARIAGVDMRAGDVILVVLAAAGRDPDAATTWSFGGGVHACPGANLAATIAEAGVRALLASRVDPARLLPQLSYRPSLNLRVARFGHVEAA